MDERLKPLMQDLGNAIDKSLSESESIAAVIGAIKQAGYDVFLVIEATIGFNKRADDADDADDAKDTGTPNKHRPLEVKFTSTDADFLKEMKITMPDDNNSPDTKEKKGK